MIITCPQCNNSTVKTGEPKHGSDFGERFRYLEDIVCYRTIVGVNHKGHLIVDGYYKSGEGYDDGTNARLECRECLTTFPLPDVEIEWV